MNIIKSCGHGIKEFIKLIYSRLKSLALKHITYDENTEEYVFLPVT